VGVLLHAAARWGGWASRSAVAAALSCTFDEFDPHVFCSTAMQKRYADVGAGVHLDPPAPRVARLLMDSALAPLLGGGIENTVTNAQADYRRAYGAFEALDARWEALRVAPMPESLNAGPLIGTVRRITRADMEARASALNAAEIACLTEPRIVDALFDRVGGFVIDSAQSDGALGARLRARGVRFAAVPAAVMSGLDEGLAVACWPRQRLSRDRFRPERATTLRRKSSDDGGAVPVAARADRAVAMRCIPVIWPRVGANRLFHPANENSPTGRKSVIDCDARRRPY
jgi:hypothetical protein